MKVHADDLEDALKPIRPVLGTGSGPMAILQNVLIEPTDGGAALVATDLDTGVRTECPAEGDVERMCLLGSQLYDFARQIDGEITIDLEENHWATLTADDVDARVVGTPPDDYPEVELESGEAHTVDGPELERLVDATTHAISTDDARANLTGAHLTATDTDKLAATSTDGHRLARLVSYQPMDAQEWPDDGALVPKGAWEQIGTLAGEYGTVRLSVTDKRIVAEADDRTISARLIEGTFPDFTQVLPDESPETALFDREELLEAVNFVAMFASTKTNNMRLTFRQGEVELYASDPDRGEGSTAVPCQYDAPESELKIGFNYTYLVDALRTLDTDEVEVDPIDTLSPMVVRPTGEDESVRVCMPMRL